MAWFFEGASLLNSGEKSDILVFTSAFFPELDALQIQSGLASPMPSPLVASISDRIFEFEVPEPASIALLVLGLATVFAGRRRRS